MTRAADFDRQLLDCRPRLLAFARKLTRNPVLSDDLVQETMARAMLKAEQFQPGTSMAAWLFMILRNDFYSRARRGKREVLDPDGVMASHLTSPSEQVAAYDLQVLFGHMEGLHFEQRVSLELVAIDGMSYEEVGSILGIPLGTVKSQVSRARAYLAQFYDGSP